LGCSSTGKKGIKQIICTVSIICNSLSHEVYNSLTKKKQHTTNELTECVTQFRPNIGKNNVDNMINVF